MATTTTWQKRAARALIGFGLTLLLIGLLAPAAGADAGGNGKGKGGSPPGLAKGRQTASTEAGANQDGPYSTSSTVTPSPSGNGNGGGNAVGKPDAGTVGNADDKNPPGQLPGPNDANAGYECDENHGVARSNPAHTGCVPTTLSPTSTTAPTVTTSTSTTTSTTSTSTSTTTTVTVPDSVLGTEITRPPAAEVEGTALARTGAELKVLLVVAGLALFSGGLVLVAGQRSSRWS